MDCDWRGTQPASILASQVSETPEAAASWRCVRPTARRRALIAAETSEALVMIVLMPEQNQPTDHLSHPPPHDVLSQEQRERIRAAMQTPRAKRERRRREFAIFPISGRDEALYWLDAFAASELVRMTEVRAILSRAAVYQQTLVTPVGRLSHWHALEQLAADYDGVLGDAGQLSQLLHGWSKIEAKIEQGSPMLFVSGGETGRPGIEQTMSRENVAVALRSLALRPRAREALLRGAVPEYRDAHHRSQSGHAHAAGARAHGASYADELAAAEINEREGRSDRYAMSRQQVEKQRARLTALLADARSAPAGGSQAA